MKNCDHVNTETGTITRELQGNFFTAQTKICKDCGAELWNERLNLDFNKWVTEIGIKPRVQFKMSDTAEQCLDKMLNKFPGANKTILVRAMIAVYLDLLKKGPEINEIFNQIFESDFYITFENDKKTNSFGTDVRAVFFFDIQSWGRIFSMKPNEMASEAFHLMMALCVSEDQELKDFWNKTILPQIETIVKAT